MITRPPERQPNRNIAVGRSVAMWPSGQESSTKRIYPSQFCCVLREEPAPNWSRPLPRPIIIPDIMELATLAGVRIPVAKHLPKEYRSIFTWRPLAGLLRRAAEGQQDVSECSVAPHKRYPHTGIRQSSIVKENERSLVPSVRLQFAERFTNALAQLGISEQVVGEVHGRVKPHKPPNRPGVRPGSAPGFHPRQATANPGAGSFSGWPGQGARRAREAPRALAAPPDEWPEFATPCRNCDRGQNA